MNIYAPLPSDQAKDRLKQEIQSSGLNMKQWYHEVYLHSPHWKWLRNLAFNGSQFCGACGSERQLQVHHLRYHSIYDVMPDDLVVLCDSCHEGAHKEKTKSSFTKEELEVMAKADCISFFRDQGVKDPEDCYLKMKTHYSQIDSLRGNQQFPVSRPIYDWVACYSALADYRKSKANLDRQLDQRI
jgi:hypothetical protein